MGYDLETLLANTLGFVHEWGHDVVLVQLDFIGFRKSLIKLRFWNLLHSYNIQKMSIVMVKKLYRDSLTSLAGGLNDATPTLEAVLSR